MKGGNASGILLIGVGVVLVQLAATGRMKAVWEAMRTGVSTPSTGTPAPPSPGTETEVPDDQIPNNGSIEGTSPELQALQDPVRVTIVSNGEEVYVDAPDLKGTVVDGGGSACPYGSTLVRTANDKLYCVNGKNIVKIPAGGDVPGIMVQAPTGKMVYMPRQTIGGTLNASVNAT